MYFLLIFHKDTVYQFSVLMKKYKVYHSKIKNKKEETTEITLVT